LQALAVVPERRAAFLGRCGDHIEIGLQRRH
jgi:hypothetical protein